MAAEWLRGPRKGRRQLARLPTDLLRGPSGVPFPPGQQLPRPWGSLAPTALQMPQQKRIYVSGTPPQPPRASVPRPGTARELQLTRLSPPCTVELVSRETAWRRRWRCRVPAGLLPESRGLQTRFTSPASPSAGCSLVILITTETGVHLGHGGPRSGPSYPRLASCGRQLPSRFWPRVHEDEAVFPQNWNPRTELCSVQVPSHRGCPPRSAHLGRAGRWMGRMLKFTPKHALAPEMPHHGPCPPRTHRRQRPCRLRGLFLLGPRGQGPGECSHWRLPLFTSILHVPKHSKPQLT